MLGVQVVSRDLSEHCHSKVYVAVGLAPFSVRVLTAPRATFWPVSYRTMHDYNLLWTCRAT